MNSTKIFGLTRNHMDDHISVDLINYNYPYIELIQTQGTPDFDFYFI